MLSSVRWRAWWTTLATVTCHQDMQAITFDTQLRVLPYITCQKSTNITFIHTFSLSNKNREKNYWRLLKTTDDWSPTKTKWHFTRARLYTTYITCNELTDEIQHKHVSATESKFDSAVSYDVTFWRKQQATKFPDLISQLSCTQYRLYSTEQFW